MALRQFSALFVMLYAVIVCGTAAVARPQPRRDTWQSLIATSLTALGVLRAEMLAARLESRSAPGLI